MKVRKGRSLPDFYFLEMFYRRGIAGTRNNNKCTYSVDSYTLLSAGHVYLCTIKVYYK